MGRLISTLALRLDLEEQAFAVGLLALTMAPAGSRRERRALRRLRRINDRIGRLTAALINV